MRILRKLVDYTGILVGSLITAVAVSGFLVPNRIAAGGASGIATLLYHLFGWSPGIVLVLINVPLLILSSLIIGVHFGLYSVLGGIATSVFVYLTETMPPVTDDPLLATLFGGIIAGIGMGIVFRSKGSTGGTDLLARIINHLTPVTLGQALLAIDVVVVALAGIVFQAEYAMYALIGLFVTAKVIDIVQEGISYTKAALIISENSQSIVDSVLNKLDRGVTEIYSRGGYTKEDRFVLLVVVRRNELARLKQVISEADPQAFVIVSDVHEVLGEGFKPIRQES